MPEIVHGDMREVLLELNRLGVRFDCAITDPPYHLGSISKRFGKPDSAPAKHGRDGAAERLSRGFMGWDGDSGEISFISETWRLVIDLLPPGGRLAAFGGTRTFWRIAAAIDAADFEYEDTIAWTYGQGLVLRRSRLKPCWEPILLFRKPGPVRDLNIDECRTPRGTKADTDGWPSNLIHDNSSEVMACFPDTPGQLAKARVDGSPKRNKTYGEMNHVPSNPEPRGDSGSAARFFSSCEFDEDEKRLIYQAKAKGRERVYRCLECDTDCLKSQLGAHEHGHDDWRHVRTHPTLKPLALMRHLVRLICPSGGTVIDPFAGTGTTVLAAMREGRDALGVEQDAVFAEHARLRLSLFS